MVLAIRGEAVVHGVDEIEAHTSPHNPNLIQGTGRRESGGVGQV
jgi:hypothetical protein